MSTSEPHICVVYVWVFWTQNSSINYVNNVCYIKRHIYPYHLQLLKSSVERIDVSEINKFGGVSKLYHLNGSIIITTAFFLLLLHFDRQGIIQFLLLMQRRNTQRIPNSSKEKHTAHYFCLNKVGISFFRLWLLRDLTVHSDRAQNLKTMFLSFTAI